MGPEQVRSMYGQLTGFAGPLINLPQVVIQAISISLVPAVVTAFKTGDRDFLHHNVVLSIKTTFIVALPCSVGMFVLAEPIMRLLYPAKIEEAVSAAPSLAILALGVSFLAIEQTLTGVLQGVEKQFIPVVSILIGAIFKAVITWVLTGIPGINIKGAAIGTVFAYFIATVLNFIAVRKYAGSGFGWRQTLVKPLVSTAVMGGVAFGAYHLCRMVTGNAVATLVAITLAGLSYVALLFITKSITEDELALLPKGEKLYRIYKRISGKR
jgi:stage V sporulation protein B